MTPRSRTSGGTQGGRLLLAAGIATLASSYLPGCGHLDHAALDAVGLVAVLLGLVCVRLPWERLHPRAPLALAPVAFALISLSSLFGGVSSSSYAVSFVVVFVWVGIAQPPGTSWWLLPSAAVAYLVPFLATDAAPANAIRSVAVALPVCLLVGEVLARTVALLEHSRHALRCRTDRVELLARVASGLGADPDAALVRQRLCEGAVELFDAEGALVIGRSAHGPVVLAGSGRTPAPGAVLAAAALAEAQPSPVRMAASRLGLGQGDAVLVVCCAEPDPLVLCLLTDGPELCREDAGLLRLLVTQGGAALASAATHAVAVAQRRHEQAVVDVLADGVLVLDARGLLLSCNDEAAGLLGAGRDALLGSAPAVVLGADGVPVHSQVGGRWIETVATRLADTDERVVTMRDISRQRALDEAKDLFLATTGHELRTPLTAIKGYVHVLQRRWDEVDEGTRLGALATIAERTDALVTLTNHLLLGARAGASRHCAARVPFDLLDAVASATAAFTTVSARHVVRVGAGSEAVRALGDVTNVAHIVGQLVENAVKYSPLGGTVEVQVRRDGGRAVVEVADEGVGLPQGDELSLFAPFFQAGQTNTREFGGIGLGLYIVQQLVEAQGGSVFARNRADVGAIVGFDLPLAVEPPSPRDGGDAHVKAGRRLG